MKKLLISEFSDFEIGQKTTGCLNWDPALYISPLYLVLFDLFLKSKF